MLRSHSSPSPSNMTHPTSSKMNFTNTLVPGVPTTRFVARNNTKSGGSVSYLVPSYSLIPTTVPSINLVNVTTYAQPNYQCITFIHQQQNYMPFECQDDKKTLIPIQSCSTGLHSAAQLDSRVPPSSVPIKKCQRLFEGVLQSSNLHGCEKICSSKPDSEVVSSNINNSSEMSLIAMKPKKKEKFPTILYKLLADATRYGRNDIICFHPHGRSFIVKDVNKFEKEVMKKYFNMSSWKSFRRQLNLYDFNRVPCGLDGISYYHKFLIFGRPHLLHQIKRTRPKGDRAKTYRTTRLHRDQILMWKQKHLKLSLARNNKFIFKIGLL